MGYYRKVILGDKATASRYFRLAEKMCNECHRRDKPKMTYNDDTIFIIAKQYDGQKKAIFIVKGGVIFIYTKTVTFSNVLTVGAWNGKELVALLTLDFNDLVDASLVNSIGYAWFLKNDEDKINRSFITMRKAGTGENPPVGNYPTEFYKSKLTNTIDEPYVIDHATYEAPETPTPDAIFGLFDPILRGTQKDFVYTTSGGTGVGDGFDPTFWYRDRDDETQTWWPLGVLTYPAPGGFTVFPTYIQDDRVVMTTDQIFYIASDNALGNSSWELWQLTFAPKGPPYERYILTTVLAFWFERDLLGGASDINFGSLTKNYVNNDMFFCFSEWLNASGAVSDYEYIYDVTGVFRLKFEPGTLLSYVRGALSKSRISKCWLINDGIYGMYIENTNNDAAIENQVPDGLFMIDDTGGAPVITLVHGAKNGLTLANLIINENNPAEIIIGEFTRPVLSGDEHRMYHVNMTSGKKTIITEDNYFLSGTTFVR